VPRVFAAGDLGRGQSLVVWAIAEGHEAAHAIGKHLMGFTTFLQAGAAMFLKAGSGRGTRPVRLRSRLACP
jgi:hypothetical protein